MRKLESKARFHLLILDNQLPGRDSLELARRARPLSHRRSMPIIMLSASDVERDALRQASTLFLRKPQDIGRLTTSVTRLLAKHTTPQCAFPVNC
jgi:DNA-binding response OmpR family regulator